MSLLDYGEDRLVEQPTIALFRELGWQTVDCMPEGQIGPQPGLSGRETLSEVVLVARLRPALERLNPTLSTAAIHAAIEELTRDLSTLSPARANRAMYRLIKDGVRVRTQGKNGEERVDVVRVIDWDDPLENDFLLTSQLWITGDLYKRRPDLVGFVNGLPLVLVELKASHERVAKAYTENISDYRDTLPHLFWHNAFITLSNGSQALIGSTTAGLEHFSAWKKITSEGEEGIISLDTMIRGACDKARLLDLVENFTLFSEERGGLTKIIAKNHQYHGVNNAIEAVRSLKENQGRLGVFWHTQGAGKSYSMIFFTQKILRHFPGNWTFVIVTDRAELDEQIYKNFANAGTVTEPEEAVRAESAEHLRQLLVEDHRHVFTLIQKFRTERGEPHPLVSRRDDIIVITDEAHRSQYDIFAQNMRDALPNAAFIGFTGTPLLVGEEKTRQVFGEYVSVYNFGQSVEDGATVPLWYENRIPELQLINENFNEDMEDLLEDAMLDEAQERRLDREFSREYHLITREERLETLARDMVEHFTGRGFLQGKAMAVCVDKATAVRMFDRVQRYWQEKIAELGAQRRGSRDAKERQRLGELIAFMRQTDMAVVVSQSQGEIEEFRQKGLDIRRHRERMVREALDEKFKDPNDPFRIVFVCAMWMTGFDAKACSTIYLDKPMRNHTLMQTIARANRVWGEKQNGLIVDYIGVFRDLQKALAIYGAPFGGPPGGELPIRDKAELIEELRSAVQDAVAFCTGLGIDLAALQNASSFDFIRLSNEAVETILINEDIKQDFLALAQQVDQLYKAILPDKLASEFGPQRAILTVLARKIQALQAPVDIGEVMGKVEGLLDESIAAESYLIAESTEESIIDLSRIDFEALLKRFANGRKRIETEKLKAAINRKLKEMVQLNKTRVDYHERLEQLIAEYNTGSRNIDDLFGELVKLAGDLNQEEQRHIAEQLTEEELAVFDLLTKSVQDLSPGERDRVKQIARDLLARLKNEVLVLDWRKRQQTRAAVRQSIELALDVLPELYDQTLYRHKCDELYQHVYDAYYDNRSSVYVVVG